MTVHMESGDSYVGATLAKYERNGYDDSDFIAIVWDEENQSLSSVEYGTTRFSTYGNYAVVDATDEVHNKVKAHLASREAKLRYSRLFFAAFRPNVGREVVVVKGRKLPKGTKGIVLRKEDSAYSHNNRYNTTPIRYEEDQNLFLQLEDGKRVWIAEANVRVTDWDIYLPDMDEVEKAVREEYSVKSALDLAYQKGHYMNFDFWDKNERWVENNKGLEVK